MSVFSAPDFDHHERVIFHHDQATGLRAMVAIHRDWTLPSVGGTRLRAYTSEDEAIADVLKLSRGMSYKCVMAGVEYGGAKAVIMADDDALRDREALFEAMGAFVDRFRGRFYTGVDFGLSVDDVRAMHHRTDYVCGLGHSDPAAATSRGVVTAIRAGVRRAFGSDDLSGLRVAVQGLGKVGMGVARLVHAAGARVLAADTNAEALAHAREHYGVEVMPVDRIHAAEADVFCPCAVGGVLDETTIGELKGRVVAGAANNQLTDVALGSALKARDIVYAPDYIANGGGLLAVVQEIEGFSDTELDRRLAHIGETLDEVFRDAESHGLTTAEAADRIAAARIAALDERTEMPASEATRKAS